MIIQRYKKAKKPWKKIIIVVLVSAALLLLHYTKNGDDQTTRSKLLELKSNNSTFDYHDKKYLYPPLSCARWIKDDKYVYPTFQDPNHGERYTRLTDRYPYFTIALHNEQFDPARWTIRQFGHYYETSLINAFSIVLNATTSTIDEPKVTRVLDVGANIGYFSLHAAGHGPHVRVDAFEPNPSNVFRICQSLQLNDWLPNEYELSAKQQQQQPQPRVNCHVYGIGSQMGQLEFHADSHNPGAGTFTRSTSNKSSNHTTVPVISLDAFATSRNWFVSRPDIAILKVRRHQYRISSIYLSNWIGMYSMYNFAFPHHAIYSRLLLLRLIRTSFRSMLKVMSGMLCTVLGSCCTVD
jgi:hypothetical protein